MSPFAVRRLLPASQPRQFAVHGFSLIELLVVIIIIALSSVMVMGSLGWQRRSPPLLEAMEELASTIELARDEAALQGRNLGIRFYPDGYEIFDLDPDTNVWLTLSDDEMLAPVQFDERVLPGLWLEEREIPLTFPDDEDSEDNEPLIDLFGNVIETASEPPHVVILSTGEVTPFQLRLDELGEKDGYLLSGDFLGNLEIQESDAL
ncbi:MAG: type II secretion system minor pseudopilin GspH [Pseudomonadota bacterium]